MKLLGWMHRKLMQNNSKDHTYKNYTIGNHPASFSKQTTLYDEQYHYIDPHSNITCKRFPNTLESRNVAEESVNEPFDFLLIGTFGTELLETDLPTPTLPMPDEGLTGQKQKEITKDDLNLVNYELEKFLEAEETEITGNDSSERTSEASVITLSNDVHMQMAACPLQNYLFAASVETEKEVKKTRTSLEELFKKSNIVDANADGPIKKVSKEDEKVKGHVGHYMKKMAKRIYSSSSTAGFDNDDDELDPVMKKLSKLLVKIFHKKVYPEEEMTKKRLFNVSKYKNKKNISSSEKDGQLAGNNKKNNTIKLCWKGNCKGDSPEYAGQWIKTDSDYFVLEL